MWTRALGNSSTRALGNSSFFRLAVVAAVALTADYAVVLTSQNGLDALPWFKAPYEDALAQELVTLKQRILSLENEVGDLRKQLSSCRAGEDKVSGEQFLFAAFSPRSSFWILLPTLLVFATLYKPRRQGVLASASQDATEAAIQEGCQHPKSEEEKEHVAEEKEHVAESPSSKKGMHKAESKECLALISRIEKRYTPHRDGSSKASDSGESIEGERQGAAPPCPSTGISGEDRQSVPWRSPPCPSTGISGEDRQSVEVERASQPPPFKPPPGLPPPDNLSPSGLSEPMTPPLGPPPGLPAPAFAATEDLPELPEAEPLGSRDEGSGGPSEEAAECDSSERTEAAVVSSSAGFRPCHTVAAAPVCAVQIEEEREMGEKWERQPSLSDLISHSLAKAHAAAAAQRDDKKQASKEQLPTSPVNAEPSLALANAPLPSPVAVAAPAPASIRTASEAASVTAIAATAPAGTFFQKADVKEATACSPAAPAAQREQVCTELSATEPSMDSRACEAASLEEAQRHEMEDAACGDEMEDAACGVPSGAQPSLASQALESMVGPPVPTAAREESRRVIKESTRWRNPACPTLPQNCPRRLPDMGSLWRQRVSKLWGRFLLCSLFLVRAPAVIARSCTKFLKMGWHRLSWCLQQGFLRWFASKPLQFENLEGEPAELRTKLRSSAASASQPPAAATGAPATSVGARTGKHGRTKAAHGTNATEGRSSSTSEARYSAFGDNLRRWAQEKVVHVTALIRSPVFLVGASMLVMVLLGKVHHHQPDVDKWPRGTSRSSASMDAHRVGDRDIPESACSFDDPLPHLRETQEPQESTDEKPRVVFYAPCLLKVYKAVAKKYRPSAVWYYVKSPVLTKVELTHRHESPLSLPGIQDNHTIVRFLLNNILPRFGEVTVTTYEWYMAAGKGMIWMLPEPGQDGSMEANLQKHRPAMLEVASHFWDTYQVFWINTKEHQMWLETWLTVTSYPAVVVQAEAADSERFTWSREITTSNIVRFVQEIERGEAVPDRHSSPLVDGLVTSKETLAQCPEEAPSWYGTRSQSEQQTCMLSTLHANLAAPERWGQH